MADYAPNFHRPEPALKQNEGESRVVIMSRKRGRKREQPIIVLATQKKEGQVFYCFSASERDYFASRIGGRRER